MPEEAIAARRDHPALYRMAQEDPSRRQEHLELFLRGHQSRYVAGLTYTEHVTAPMEHDAGIAFVDDPALRRATWGYRTHRPAQLHITPVAYDGDVRAFESIVVDKGYDLARTLAGMPHVVLPIPRDLRAGLSEPVYRLLRDTAAVRAQVRNGARRGIIGTPILREAALSLAACEEFLLCVPRESMTDRIYIDLMRSALEHHRQPGRSAIAQLVAYQRRALRQ